MITSIKKKSNGKEKPAVTKKKRINWSQSLKSLRHKYVLSRKEKFRLQKSLRYVLLLRKYKNIIDFTNVKLIKAFVSKSGKIKASRKTRIKQYQQRKMAKAIRRARMFGLLPFTACVNV